MNSTFFFNTTIHNDDITTTIKKNITTGAIIEKLITTSNWTDHWSDFYTFKFPYPLVHMNMTAKYACPIQISNFLMTTTTGTIMEWTTLFLENIIYNDSNKNGIYDCGGTNTINGVPSLSSSDEYRGVTFPGALDAIADYAYYYKNGTLIQKNRQPVKYPENINFTALIDKFAFNWEAPSVKGSPPQIKLYSFGLSSRHEFLLPKYR